MSSLKYSKALRRKIRQDEPASQSIPTWDLLREAIKGGKTDEALELVEHLWSLEEEIFHGAYGVTDFYSKLLTRIAELGGEEEVMKMYRERSLPRFKAWLETTPGAEESLQRNTELQRSHHAKFTVTEEPDRYVVRYDSCGSAGVLRRKGEVGKTKKAYPWTWGKVGVPYYCVHCAVQWEIVPIELRGYPIRITLFNDDPYKPCVHLFYKKPELIPEEYFTRVGKTKTVK